MNGDSFFSNNLNLFYPIQRRMGPTVPDKVRVVEALEKKPDLDFASEDMMTLEVPQFEDGK